MLVLADHALSNSKGAVDAYQFFESLSHNDQVGVVPKYKRHHSLGVDSEGGLVVSQSVMHGFADVGLRVVDPSGSERHLSG